MYVLDVGGGYPGHNNDEITFPKVSQNIFDFMTNLKAYVTLVIRTLIPKLIGLSVSQILSH